MRPAFEAAAALLLLFQGGAFAQERPAAPPAPIHAKPDTPDQAVDRVLAAAAAKDEAALKALAAKDDPDPWIVADALCARGEGDAAESFAKAAPRKDTEGLPGYVASRRGLPEDLAAGDALKAAVAALQAKDFAKALAAADAVAVPPPTVVGVSLTQRRGMALRGLKRMEESVRAFDDAAEQARGLGWLVGIASSLHAGGMSASLGYDWEGALARFQARLALEEERGDRAATAAAASNLGVTWIRLGKYARARERIEQAVGAMEGLGDPAKTATALMNLGSVDARLGEYGRAQEHLERALAIRERLGDRAGAADVLTNIAGVHDFQGRYALALECQERALGIHEALGDRAGVARCLGNIGTVYLDLGLYERALEYLERALKMDEERADRPRMANSHQNIGIALKSLARYDSALEHQELALRLEEQLGNRAGQARSLGAIGITHYLQGDLARAADFLERSLRMSEEAGDRDWVAGALLDLGEVHAARGEKARALECAERSLRLARDIGSSGGQVLSLKGVASAQRALGRPAEAVEAAREAVALLPALVQGVGDEAGAHARGKWSGVFRVGLQAAFDAGDVAAGAFFAESGRAGSLLEMLSLRGRMQETAVPSALKEELDAARGEEAAARTFLSRAERRGSAEETRQRRGELRKAQEQVAAAVGRIQRQARAAADVTYPKADELPVLQARLRPEESLVLYGIAGERILGIVVTAKDVRMVDLGPPKPIEESCAALNLEDGTADPAPALGALQKLVVEPLALDAKTTRLLLSPDGALSYVPFALLAGDRDVVCVPSGTTYGILLEDAGKRGEGVLALGDPDYGAGKDPREVAMLRGGRRTVPLPATKVEAKAVGTTVLLGKEATETGLRTALAKQPRWRAVHLACHGLIDAERPYLSSLALATEKEEDGYLTVLEVFGAKCPADLVVLSACETGSLGLTRAFMFAGAPRVLVSLWKVDDEATKALMTKFYELWNPRDASKGLGAAAALRSAQDFVRSQEKWKHPRYWAAWVLWGLPD